MRPQHSAGRPQPNDPPYTRTHESITEQMDHFEAYSVDSGPTLRVGDEFWYREGQYVLEIEDVIEVVRRGNRGSEISRGPIQVVVSSDHPKHDSTRRLDLDGFVSGMGTDEDAVYVPHNSNGWLPRQLRM